MNIISCKDSIPIKTIHQMKKDKEDALLKKREEAERKVRIIIIIINILIFVPRGVGGTRLKPNMTPMV